MWVLTHEGKYVKQCGSPEYRVYNMVDPEYGTSFEIILQELGKVGKMGYEFCLKEGYLEYNLNKRLIFRKREFEEDMIKFYLTEIDNGYYLSKSIMSILKKRNLIENL